MTSSSNPETEQPEYQPSARRFPIGYVILGIVFAILFIRLFNSFQNTHKFDGNWIGQPAPNMILTDLSGTVHNLSELKGKKVFLVFWSITCPPCLHELPELVKVRQSVSTDSLVILGLTGDDAETLRQRNVVQKMGINFPIISYTGQLDKIVPPYRNVNLIPTLMVINPEGVFETIEIGGSSYEELMALAIGEPGAEKG